MARYTRGTLTGSNAPVNTETQKIEAAINDTLSRKGDQPNSMEAPLDMNSERLYNLPSPTLNSDAATKGYVDSLKFNDVVVNQNYFETKTPQFFGAVGDGVTDDTEALQLWAAQGGYLPLPRGVYYVTAPILFGDFCNIQGESHGPGTGANPSLEQSAELGASIIKVDASFVGDSVLKFRPSIERDLGSVSVCNICVYNDRINGADAHMIDIARPYDGLYLSNINLMFAGPNSNAIRITTGGLEDIAQTGVMQNIVAIGDDDNVSTTPVIYLQRQQEFILVGVKSFAGAGSIPGKSKRVPFLFEECRGLASIGCSAALGDNYGVIIKATTRSTDGISMVGWTYEDMVQGGWLIDGSSLGAGITITKVNVTDPRYQFPQPIAGVVDNASDCELDCGTSTVTLRNGASGILCKGFQSSQLDDQTVSKRNMFIASTNSVNDYTFNNSVRVSKENTPSVTLSNTDGSKGYILRASVNDEGDDFGFAIQRIDSDTFVVLDGQNLAVQSDTPNVRTGLRLDDELGDPSTIRVTSEDNLTINDKPTYRWTNINVTSGSSITESGYTITNTGVGTYTISPNPNGLFIQMRGQGYSVWNGTNTIQTYDTTDTLANISFTVLVRGV